MWIISQKRIKNWWKADRKRLPVKEPLRRWMKTVKGAAWADTADVKATFGKRVDFVRSNAPKNSKLTVFDVHGNHCRIIAAVHYFAAKPKSGRIFILRVLTHPEYDTNKWKDEL